MENKSSNLHLYLGLTRNELKRRLTMGLIDPEILKHQIADYNSELKLNALSEAWIEAQSMEQVDKFTVPADKATNI